MEYTVIGDTVNQAARLEGTAKYYGVEFLVGWNTYQLTRDIYGYRELDKIRMLGKQTPIAIYELIGLPSDQRNELATQFGVALAMYRARNWQEAKKHFASILLQYAEDQPCKIYIERCEYFIKSPPAEDWDGVFNRVDK